MPKPSEQRAKEFELFLANRNPKDLDGGECERISQPSEPIRLETEKIFDPELERPDPEFLSEMEEFLDNPMKPLVGLLGQYLERMTPKAFEPVKTEHKVRIFRLNDKTKRGEVASEIEALLNDGYCCHMPTVVGDYVIMDFSRRKESEEDGRNTG